MVGGSAAVTLPAVGADVGITASAADENEGTYVSGDYWSYYWYPDGTAKIAHWNTYHVIYDSSNKPIEVKHTDYPEVPAYIDGYKVTSIGRGAFGVYNSESVRTSDGTMVPLTIEGARGVTLPDTVKEIDQMAFFRNINLTYVILPEGLESIDMEAFCGCNALTGITLPDSLKKIESYAFAETAITSVHVKSTLESWGRAFESCKILTDVTIDDDVKEIPNYAFSNCASLSEIKLPSSLESLGRFAFSNTAIKSVKIPETMTSLGGAFINCAELTEINIPEGVTELCPNEFNGCKSLENIDLPSGLTVIGSPYAFSESAIKTITIPAGVKEIPYGAFCDCDSLESVVFDGKITKIGDLAFANCGSLTSITPAEISASLGRGAFSGCKSLKSVILGKNTYGPSDSGIGYWYNKEAAATEKVPDFKIYCYEGSWGEQYAKDNEFDCEYIYEVTDITLDETELNLTTGESKTLNAIITPDNAYDKNVTWTVTNDNVATVENGKVTAVSAGTATITAKTTNGKKARCTVTVKDPVIEAANVTLDKTTLDLTKGDSATLTATVTPENATDTTVTWTTSNDKVASVESGKVTALSAGTTAITATTANGLTATATVTVTEPTPVVTDISKATVSGIANKTYTGKKITQSITVKLGNTTLNNDTDYSVDYKNNKDAGTATVTVTGKGSYSGQIEKTFTINKAKIDSATVTVAAQTYTGKALTPAPTVKLTNTTLKKGTDYTVKYTDNTNVGTAKVTVTGKGNYSGTVTKTFTIKAKAIKTAKLSGVSASYKYTGKAQTPTVTVKDGTKTLKKGTDYTVTYKNNKAIGTATITIKGKNNYSGTVTKTFKIIPKTITLKTVTSPKTKQLKATWAKDTTVNGYQIQYSTSSTFKSGNKTKMITKNSTTSAIIGSLTKGKTYYVRIRAYKTVNGQKVYGAYSTVKKVKIK